MLGGLNGLTTGVPSGIKGQAIPNRCWQYAAGMRRVVAGEIGKLERRVQAGGAVTEGERSRLGKCMKLFSGSVIWVFRMWRTRAPSWYLSLGLKLKHAQHRRDGM
jgi:hypothetical protein